MIGVYIIIMMNILQESKIFARRLIHSPSTQNSLLCKHCAHFLPKAAAFPIYDPYATDLCKKFGYKNNSTDEICYSDAKKQRAFGPCGVKAKFYESRKNGLSNVE
jgi:hypothetical protein